MAQVQDVVCGMTIEDSEAAATVDHDGKTYYFCSVPCARAFEAHPDDYL